jgi:lipoprotein-anchoring transpeptidase ErfK/SrfK
MHKAPSPLNRSRAALTGALVVLCALAGLLAAATLAAGATQRSTDPGTDTTATGTDTAPTTTTTTETTTTETTTTTPAVIPEGVTAGGVPVGGLSPNAAASTIGESFAQPVVLLGPSYTLRLDPASVGAHANVARAVSAALRAAPGAAVPLAVSVAAQRVDAYVAKVAHRYDRTPLDSVVVLRHLKPFVSKGHPGRTLKRRLVEQAILVDLRQNRRVPVKLTGVMHAQKVTRKSFGPVIVIKRDTHHLTLYNGMRYVRVFGVATGQAQYPTPLGRFAIVAMWRNPWWFPPNSPWAVGEHPTPPGPGNPLGTRWMGLSSPGVGIHGTPKPESIGYSLSHGCIRMRIPDAEWLFEHVRVGATVFIVPA